MHISSYLSRSDLFAGLALPTIETVAQQFRHLPVKAGETIIEEGTRGQTYYLIATGEAVVWKGNGASRWELQRLGPGDGFGEMSLLADEPRSASVMAASDMELLCLDREPFVFLMEQDEQFGQRILRLMLKRLRQSNQIGAIDLLRAHQGLIISLAQLAELRDSDTGAHLYRVRDYCTLLARLMGEDDRFKEQVTPGFIEALYYVSPLHDIGKVSIADAILHKQGRLTPEEFDVIKTHTLVGAKALETVLEYCDLAMFHIGHDIVLCHHERYDGNGYPSGVKGDDIPIAARIMSIVDHYDAIRSKRVYKPAFTMEEAVENIRQETGKRFDPAVAAIMLDHIDQFEAIHQHYAEHKADAD